MIRNALNRFPKRTDSAVARIVRVIAFSLLGLIVAALGLAATASTIRPNPKPESGVRSPQLAGEFVRLPGHVLPALAKAKKIVESAEQSGKEAAEPITLTMVLRRDDQAGFERFLHDVYDRRSPDFHHFLKQEQLADRFGPSPSDYQAVIAYMRANGFTLAAGSKNRLTITMRGTRAMAERAFKIKIRNYRDEKISFYASDSDPALPESLAASVQAVIGLSNRARPHPAIMYTLGRIIICKGAYGFNPTDIQKKADFKSCISFSRDITKYDGPADEDPPGWEELDGAGQTIGLVEFDSFQTSDVTNYLNLIGAPSSAINNLSESPVQGGVTPGANQDEVLLDIDTVMTLAPGAKVVVYDAPFSGPGTSFQAVFNAAIGGGSTVISNSWAYCEDQTSLADVQSIDSILKNAAAAGISVFNGAGDSGSTCLDGSPSVIAVPADSPNATAVGGSSLVLDPGLTTGTETWWNGSNATPPTGQGGYGVSKFFTAPAYQSGLSTMRSVPDVVSNADPAEGVSICEASNGGCPNGLTYGGTSLAAPAWASFAAILNEALGRNIGTFNSAIYPLASTSAFNDASALGTDFSHVGLGSPNLNQLYLKLSGQSVTTVSPTLSAMFPHVEAPLGSPEIPQDDGTSQAIVNVRLLDTNGNPVGGKTVTLAASPSSNVKITPSSAVSSTDSGVATFSLTDLTPETLTLTATDSSDGIALTQQPTINFAVAAAAVGTISASLNTNPADGTTADTITVTLQDSLSRPTPGKVVSLSQGNGNSAIAAPSPAVTDSSGQIQFAVTDTHTENVTYTATDITDGNLPVPGNATVDFTNGAGGCYSASYVHGGANPASGYLVSTFADGFAVSGGNQGFSYNCFGAWGMAWDAAGNMYVTDWPTGDIYKFDPSGGVADSSHLFATVKAPASGVAIDPAGNMFASEASASGPFGDIVRVDLSTGAVGAAIASGIECLGSMALNPGIPALFAIDFCNIGQGGNNNIYEVTGIDDSSPSMAVYAQIPSSNTENFQLAVAPDGTLYDLFGVSGGADFARISNASPPVVTTLASAGGTPISASGGLGITVGGMQSSGDSQFLIASFAAQAGLNAGVQTLDLTGTAPAPAVSLTTNYFSGLSNYAIGPDGCLYVAGGPTVSRITNADGSCGFGPVAQPPAITLSPAEVSPNPLQGGSQNLTATLHYVASPQGTPINFSVSGVNPQVAQVNADSSGQAAFNYTGIEPGADTVVATSAGASSSNPVEVDWNPGQDVTFLTLNPSAKGGIPGMPVTITAALSDVSHNPAVPVANQPVILALGSDSCGSAMTDSSGFATCTIQSPTIIPGNPARQLTASFAGSSGLTASNASVSFMFSAPPEDAKLIVTPKTLNFPFEIELGGAGATSKPKRVVVFNPKTKKQDLNITFLGAGNTGDFSILSGSATTCGSSLAPKSKCVIAMAFTPTAAGKRTGVLMIDDNASLDGPQYVNLQGVGKQGALRYDPHELLFGNETVNNTTAAKTVKVSNPNPVPMAFAVSVSGDFQISSNSCPSTLPPDTTKSPCEIGVTFKPTATGPRTGALTFTDTAIKSPQEVKLTGSGK